MAKKKRRTRTKIYEDALINIWKLAAKCWDGQRVCHDSQYVARMAIAAANPALHERLDSLPYQYVDVKKDGKVVIRRPLKRKTGG